MMSILRKPYDLLEIKKFNILGTIGVTLFVFVFLWIFEPFGLYNVTSLLQKFYVISLYVFCALFIVLINQFSLQNIFIKKYTIGNTILWQTWLIVVIAGSNLLINTFLFDEGRFYLSTFIKFLGITAIIAVFPISIIILLHYNFLLKKRIEKANSINQSIQNEFKTNKKNERLSINSSNLKYTFDVLLDSLIYITSADNYIDVYYLKNDVVKNQLIRNTLTNVENFLSNIKEIKRCHKSYIINTDHVTSIIGNSAGYKLKLDKIDTLIPVSKKYNSTILESLNRKN